MIAVVILSLHGFRTLSKNINISTLLFYIFLDLGSCSSAVNPNDRIESETGSVPVSAFDANDESREHAGALPSPTSAHTSHPVSRGKLTKPVVPPKPTHLLSTRHNKQQVDIEFGLHWILLTYLFLHPVFKKEFGRTLAFDRRLR